MVGHKVRCECGFVFRLGSKQDKKAGVAKKLKEKRKAKQKKQESQSGLDTDPVLNPTVDTRLDNLEPLAPIGSGYENNLFSDSDSIPMAQPVSGSPNGNELIDPGNHNELIAEIISEEFHEHEIVPLEHDEPIDYLATPAPRKKKSKTGGKNKTKPRGKSEFSVAGPIWSLAVSLLFSPLLLLLAVLSFGSAYAIFASVTKRSGGEFSAETTLPLLFLGLVGLALAILSIAVFVQGVVAIIEMVYRNYITWPCRVSAVIAVVFIGFFIVGTVSQAAYIVVGGAETDMTVPQRLMAIAKGSFTFLLIPIIVALHGFSRSRSNS